MDSYGESKVEEILTNGSYQYLHSLLIYSLGGDKNSKKITELLIYLLNINKQQWNCNPQQMTQYKGYFLKSQQQIMKDLFVSDTYVREGLTDLMNRDLIYFEQKGKVKDYRIFVKKDKITELINNNKEKFEEYRNDCQKQSLELKEERLRKQLETKEMWKNINDWKYLSLLEFSSKIKQHNYDFDDVDMIIISFISKGYWKEKQQLINWTESDLNIIRLCVCEEYRNGNKELQSEGFYRNCHLQRLVDVCSSDITTYDYMDCWSLRYREIYNEIGRTYGPNPYSDNKNNVKDRDYYLSDITKEIEYFY